MQIEQIKTSSLLTGLKGLKNIGMIYISEDKKTHDSVIVVAKGIHREYGLFNLPHAMWRVTCKTEEVKQVVDQLLSEKILADVP